MPRTYWPIRVPAAGVLAGLLSVSVLLTLTLTLTLTLALAVAAAPLQAEEIIASGEFYDAHHPTSGRAVIVARDDGGYELRFEDFTSDAGPDLFIYLSTAEEPHSDAAIKNAENANLGPRKALTGGQSYILPAGVSPQRFKSVAIWCRTYSVMFGAAPLEPH